MPKRPKEDPVGELIEACSLAGIPQREIAKAIGVSMTTLSEKYRERLDVAVTAKKTQLAKTAWNMAISGKVPAMTMFMCKTQLGWRERDKEDQQPTAFNLTIVSGERPARLNVVEEDKEAVNG